MWVKCAHGALRTKEHEARAGRGLPLGICKTYTIYYMYIQYST